MSKAVMMSLHPKWIELILQGMKTPEEILEEDKDE